MVVQSLVVCRASSSIFVGIQATVSSLKSSESAFSGAQLPHLKKKMGSATSSSASSRPSPVVTNASGDTSQQTDFKSISEEEWRKRLNQQQFYVARKKGTERAFSGEYWNTKTAGTYLCVCCKTPLFTSSTKFDSGTGWPSYWEYVGDNVKSHMDWTIPFMPRTEVVCAVCDAHLGHVFSDGPKPTGKRYCINSASLDFKPEERK